MCVRANLSHIMCIYPLVDLKNCYFFSLLAACDKTLLDGKIKKRTCLELYQFQDEDSRPEKVITLTARKDISESKQIRICEKLCESVLITQLQGGKKYSLA